MFLVVLTASPGSITIRDPTSLIANMATVPFSWCEVLMSFSTRILPGLALFLAAVRAAGQTVDHYDLAPSVLRANGQAIYPAGVSDPSLANPPGPPPESAIPTPPTPGLPGGHVAGGPACRAAGGFARLVAQRSGQSEQCCDGTR